MLEKGNIRGLQYLLENKPIDLAIIQMREGGATPADLKEMAGVSKALKKVAGLPFPGKVEFEKMAGYTLETVGWSWEIARTVYDLSDKLGIDQELRDKLSEGVVPAWLGQLVKVEELFPAALSVGFEGDLDNFKQRFFNLKKAEETESDKDDEGREQYSFYDFLRTAVIKKETGQGQAERVVFTKEEQAVALAFLTQVLVQNKDKDPNFLEINALLTFLSLCPLIRMKKIDQGMRPRVIKMGLSPNEKKKYKKEQFEVVQLLEDFYLSTIKSIADPEDMNHQAALLFTQAFVEDSERPKIKQFLGKRIIAIQPEEFLGAESAAEMFVTKAIGTDITFGPMRSIVWTRMMLQNLTKINFPWYQLMAKRGLEMVQEPEFYKLLYAAQLKERLLTIGDFASDKETIDLWTNTAALMQGALELGHMEPGNSIVAYWSAGQSKADLGIPNLEQVIIAGLGSFQDQNFRLFNLRLRFSEGLPKETFRDFNASLMMMGEVIVVHDLELLDADEVDLNLKNKLVEVARRVLELRVSGLDSKSLPGVQAVMPKKVVAPVRVLPKEAVPDDAKEKEEEVWRAEVNSVIDEFDSEGKLLPDVNGKDGKTRRSLVNVYIEYCKSRSCKGMRPVERCGGALLQNGMLLRKGEFALVVQQNEAGKICVFRVGGTKQIESLCTFK